MSLLNIPQLFIAFRYVNNSMLGKHKGSCNNSKNVRWMRNGIGEIISNLLLQEPVDCIIMAKITEQLFGATKFPHNLFSW